MYRLTVSHKAFHIRVFQDIEPYGWPFSIPYKWKSDAFFLP
nr:MAG TPA: hypothetical protein [Caudoviricetes sp.]